MLPELAPTISLLMSIQYLWSDENIAKLEYNALAQMNKQIDMSKRVLTDIILFPNHPNIGLKII